MNTNKVIRNILGVFLVVSIGWFLAKSQIAKNGTTKENSCSTSCTVTTDAGCNTCGDQANIEKIEVNPQTTTHTTVYYFHGNKRCTTCKTIEKYTKQIVANEFGKQVEDKSLRFHAVNLDLAENKHFVQDFQLTMRSVVVAKYVAGKVTKFNDLKEVWTYVRNQPEFSRYLKYGISATMKGDS